MPKYLSAESYADVASERQRLLALLNSLVDPVLALDKNGHVYLCNEAALKLIGDHDAVGRLFSDILPLVDSAGKPVDIFSLAAGENRTVERADLCFYPKSGPEICLDVTLAPVHALEADHRRWGGYTVVCRDITEQREIEEEKNEFIAVASHELRTPLAIAEANLSTALVPSIAKMNDKATEMVEQARENVLFLIDLVKDLTTLSRAEKGMDESKLATFDLEDLIEEMHRDYVAHTAEKNLAFSRLVKGQPRPIYSCRSELQEILQNLIINAIKYTDHGEIQLETNYLTSTVQVSVRDTGIGIPLEEQSQVFDKFFRSNDARVRSASGTGLGLYIARKLADHLGLSLNFVSTPDEGSTFNVTIPCRREPN